MSFSFPTRNRSLQWCNQVRSSFISHVGKQRTFVQITEFLHIKEQRKDKVPATQQTQEYLCFPDPLSTVVLSFTQGQ